jgi:hypothetical protein
MAPVLEVITIAPATRKKRKSTTGSNGSCLPPAAATVKKDAATTVKDRKSVDAETAAKKRKGKRNVHGKRTCSNWQSD